MAEKQKWHIGKNGPAPCNAHPERPGGRACRYADQEHGDRAEVEAAYEKQMAEADGPMKSVKKKSQKKADASSTGDPAKDRQITQTKERLSEPAFYIKDDENEKNTAMRLALKDVSPLAYTPVKSEDDEFYSEGFSSTHRLELEDGTKGYFKPFMDNSDDGGEAYYVFNDYSETPMNATVNEVNSHRMAKAMGDGYDKLVPETVIREYDGKLGSFQKEVNDEEPHGGSQHDAAVFDFVIGSRDRHIGNLIPYQERDGQHKYTLIDNSFSFTHNEMDSYAVNQSYFTSKEYGSPLTSRDYKALDRAESAVNEWEKEGTVSSRCAGAVRDRVQYLRDNGALDEFSDYFSSSKDYSFDYGD